jgi:sugar/nucleoside kinase (ribokinase family)
MAVPNFDLAVVGHFSVDTIILPTRTKPFTVLGGAATYTSFAAKNLDASVSVISRVGEHFPEAYLWWVRQENINIDSVHKIANEPTTCFELEYSNNLADRVLKLRSKGPAITVDDIPSDFRAKAIHVAPIANEVNYAVVEKLKKCCDIISLDPQGLLRSFDEVGNVAENQIFDHDIFSLINIYKSSQGEIFALTGEKELKAAIKAIHDIGVETVIVTMGSKGSLLSVEGAQYSIATCPSEVVVDPTGAGDVFIGGFLVEYIRQKESLWCAYVGSSAASFVIEGIGPTFFGKKELIYQRAKDIFEKHVNK